MLDGCVTDADEKWAEQRAAPAIGVTPRLPLWPAVLMPAVLYHLARHNPFVAPWLPR